MEVEAGAGRQALAVEPQAGAAVGEGPRGAMEVEAGAGRQALAVEPQAGAAAREGPRGAAVVARRAWEAPQAPARVASPSGVLPVEVCHSIRRICFLEEMTCGTSGTLPGGRPVRPGRVERARTALRVRVASLRVAVFRSARTLAQTRGSCFRRMRSAYNVRFLVHLRQRSYSMLISILVGFTHRWL
jgi:hypothetical protein